MKILVTLMACIAAFAIGVISGVELMANEIDLPEETKALSANPARPDTLTGYQVNGKIYIQFACSHEK